MKLREWFLKKFNNKASGIEKRKLLTEMAEIFRNFLILIFFPLIFSACSSSAKNRLQDFHLNAPPKSPSGNIFKLIRSIRENEENRECWFTLIADTQNLVRAEDFNHFNLVARHMLFDENGKDDKFKKISFIVHNGDLVYNGADRWQWESLKKASSLRDFNQENTPYIKMLARSKPLLPVIGNHDLMRLKLSPQTAWKDLAGSTEGLRNFREFFNWENLMASGSVITQIPAEISAEMFIRLEQKLEKEDQERLRNLYCKKDGRWYLKIWQDIIGDAEKDPQPDIRFYERQLLAKRSSVIKEAQIIFNKLGYQIIHSIASEAFICYAVEFRGMLLLFLDSMARGWHYPQFTRLKKALFRDKNSQHRLNLFSRSVLLMVNSIFFAR